MGRNTERTHHRNFNPPPPHGAENFKAKHFLYQHFFFFENKCTVRSIFLFSLWSAYFFSTGKLKCTVDIFLYSHNKHTKKCSDWTHIHDPTGSNLSSCPYSQEWWVSLLCLPLCSHRPCGQLLIRTDNGVCWPGKLTIHFPLCSQG